MDEPSVISNRLTETAKDTIDGARAIAKDAIADAADVQNFTAAKVIDSYFRAVELAMTSSMQATKDVLGIVPPGSKGQKITEAAEGRRLVADAMEAIAKRMVRQAREVAKETADAIDVNPVTIDPTDPNKLIPNPNGPSVWVKSMAKLGDIALLGGIELAETALIGPAPFERDPVTSDAYAVGGNGRRRVKVVDPPGIARPGTSDPIELAHIEFRLANGSLAPGGVLEANQNEFYLSVNPAGLISGIYVGQVVVTQWIQNAEGVWKDGPGALQTITVEVPV